MKLFFIISLQLFVTFSLVAQNSMQQALWQQRVDCRIDVQLQPVTKTLAAFMQMHYYNHSPDTLRSIWLHVWPNAYKNDQTAFAKQELQKGKTDFHFSKESEKGHIGGFRFMVNGDTLQWEADPVHIDIIEVKLSKPLPPGSDIVISTPFSVKLPKIFSRSGYKDSFFSITQWYPKPAVYDVNGWNVMPYLDQGEFYSEFGDYMVDVTVPKPFMVASAGHLMRQRDTLTEGVRCVKYTYAENNIHDFAWFAAKDFEVSSRTIVISNNDSVKLQVYSSGNAKDKEKQPIYYLDQAVTEYSERVGNYPYKTCTVVIGPLEAGAGMEYPTITICGTKDGTTIIHEVGHNWFYGMLGSNERRHPWMDESINTFYEQWISGGFKPETGFFKYISNQEWLGKYQDHLAYLFSARQGISQPLSIPAGDFTRLNYGAVLYAKGPLMFAYLKQQLGDSVFTSCVRDYFREWKYRHPLPRDMQNSFERSSGRNLDWFFIDLVNEDNEVDIVRKWRGFRVKGSKKLDSMLRKKDFSSANPYGFLPEKNYINNRKDRKLFSIAVPFSLPKHNALIAINITPIIGFNYYDKFYAGALLFNRSIFRNKLEYTLMPAYSFSRDKLIGYAQLNGLFLSKGKCLYKVEGGLQGHSFGIGIADQINQYYRINPYVRFHFRHKGRVPELIEKQLSLDFYHTGLMNSQYLAYVDSNTQANVNFPVNYFFNYYKLSYSIENKHPVNAFGSKINVEYGYNHKLNPGTNNYLKTWINTFYKYSFAAKNKFFRSELFAGIFLFKNGNIGAQQFYLSANSGKMDYTYNEALMGRNETIFNNNNVIGRQLINSGGNMRNLIPLNGSDRWMLSLNNEISLPGFIPFRLYADLGYYQYLSLVNTSSGTTSTLTKPELHTTAGLLLPLFKNKFEIFVPLYQSVQFRDIYKYQKFNIGNVIGFKLHLNKLNPFKMIDNYKFF